MQTRITLTATIALAGFLLGTQAGADGHGDTANYRSAVMSAMAGHISSISAIARGRVPFESHASGHATALGATADMIGDLFPEGSGGDDTDALDSIWEDAEGFAAAVAAYEDAARAMAEAGGADSQGLMRAMANLGRTCSGCHDNYRRPDE